MRHLPLFLPLLGLGLACSNDPAGDAMVIDTGVTEADGGVDPGGPEFDTEVVEGLNSVSLVGDFAMLRLKSDGTPTAAYGYVASGDVEPHIHYAEKSGASWVVEDVIEIGRNGRRQMGSVPPYGTLDGIGFDLVGGVPHISYFGGAFDGPSVMLTPGPHITDFMLSTKTGATWSERTLVLTSADVAFDCTAAVGTPYCQVGYAVGPNSALAARPGGGFGAIYRDIHFAFGDLDFERADVEYFAEGGGPGPGMIDAVRSGGEQSSMIFTAQGRPVAAYLLPLPAGLDNSRVGIWVSYHDGTDWQRVQVAREVLTSARTSLALGPDGTLYLAFFDANAWDLSVAESTDGGATWTVTKVDESGKTGLHPSIAVDGDGRAVVAYTYCGKTTNRDCPGSLGPESEIRLARKEATGWKKYLVDDGQGLGGVGLFNQIAVGPDNKLQIIYQDPINSDLVYLKEK